MIASGETVGRYTVDREIGRGGMAVVYLAEQGDLDRRVALKQLAGLHASDPASVARFLYESRVTGGLQHPNIVTVYEYFQADGVPFIAMEYLDRGSLRAHVGRLTLPQVCGVMEGLLAALAHAADRGIVHRDLKPENVMLTSTGGVKVGDFGIAKALGDAGVGFATATGTTVGTPVYMAPEQAMGQEVSPSTDLYAAGVMAYELVLGRVPFPAEQTPVAVLLKHVNEPPPPAAEIDPDIDPALAAWLARMLAKDPSDRPEDAPAAWEALEEIVLRLEGPRWRREARIVAGAAPAAEQRPLTPAPFSQQVETPPPAATDPSPAPPADPTVAPPVPTPPRRVAARRRWLRDVRRRRGGPGRALAALGDPGGAPADTTRRPRAVRRRLRDVRRR